MGNLLKTARGKFGWENRLCKGSSLRTTATASQVAPNGDVRLVGRISTMAQLQGMTGSIKGQYEGLVQVRYA